MEELRRAAIASYEHVREKDKKSITKTFKAMDKNRDEQISLGEYVKSLEKKKAYNLTPQIIFSALDKDGNGSLDFEDVIVLHYIMQSGRAIICMSCKTLMAGAYFSCSQCFFNASVSTFDICCDCYGGKKFTHHGDATFCDNYTLLRQSRSAIQEAPMKEESDVFEEIDIDMISSVANLTVTAGCIIM
ncbi:hypothetical protein DKX38_029120 [Salix brachista]|uniref:EF-hand domain-containing protein n=1 Tax=Salix brachista TaxID=2182728 RepID=A0A5N5IZY0_9ROSI|nr:hypothetical protein DKX38_029120 [Salix brachista]